MAIHSQTVSSFLFQPNPAGGVINFREYIVIASALLGKDFAKQTKGCHDYGCHDFDCRDHICCCNWIIVTVIVVTEVVRNVGDSQIGSSACQIDITGYRRPGNEATQLWCASQHHYYCTVLALFPGSPREQTKNGKERGEPSKIHHMRNVTVRENLITCGLTNELACALLTEYTCSVTKALWLAQQD